MSMMATDVQGKAQGWSNNIDSDSGTKEYGTANSSSPIRHTKKFSDINLRELN